MDSLMSILIVTGSPSMCNFDELQGVGKFSKSLYDSIQFLMNTFRHSRWLPHNIIKKQAKGFELREFKSLYLFLIEKSGHKR
jgi:hypothetical protein